MSTQQVIVVGGGLSGLSAAHTVLQNGGRVVVLDKNAFMGGNSTKATSGINGAGTRIQKANGVEDSVEAFYKDTALSARHLLREDLVKVLTGNSASAVEWLEDSFGLNLSLLGRLGGHSYQRTHRGKEKFPGMVITYALMEKIEEISEKTPDLARVIHKAKVNKLLTDSNGTVTGVQYVKGGKTFTEHGPVIIATGGYGADFSSSGLLAKHRPDIVSKNLSTTNGNHCTGDGIKIAEEIGAGLSDMKCVQVHPTGLVDPKDPDSKVRFLAAGALRGAGGILIDADGKRFCDGLGHRDYVTGMMWKNKGPFRLLLNSGASTEMEWHCKHYRGRGLMKRFDTAYDLAKEMGVSPDTLRNTFDAYNKAAREKNDEFGRKFFANTPLSMDQFFHVAVVTPVVHYTMGGLSVNAATEVRDTEDKPIPGLYAAGEVMGGTHGENRLGGSSLLDCVVFGRVAGDSATEFVNNGGRAKSAARRVSTLSNQLGGNVVASVQHGGAKTTVSLDPKSKSFQVVVTWD